MTNACSYVTPFKMRQQTAGRLAVIVKVTPVLTEQKYTVHMYSMQAVFLFDCYTKNRKAI